MFHKKLGWSRFPRFLPYDDRLSSVAILAGVGPLSPGVAALGIGRAPRLSYSGVVVALVAKSLHAEQDPWNEACRSSSIL